MATKGRTKNNAFPEIKEKNEGKFGNWVKQKACLANLHVLELLRL